jgi:hypothetical protein
MPRKFSCEQKFKTRKQSCETRVEFRDSNQIQFQIEKCKSAVEKQVPPLIPHFRTQSELITNHTLAPNHIQRFAKIQHVSTTRLINPRCIDHGPTKVASGNFRFLSLPRMRGHAAFTPPRSLQHNHVACGEIPSRLLQKFLICVLVDHDVDEIKSGSDGAEMGREVIEPDRRSRIRGAKWREIEGGGGWTVS